MDPGAPLAGGLLAFLYDREGLAIGRRFRAQDAVDLRSALAARWRGREAALGAEEIRFWLNELWAERGGHAAGAGAAQAGRNLGARRGLARPPPSRRPRRRPRGPRFVARPLEARRALRS